MSRVNRQTSRLRRADANVFVWAQEDRVCVHVLIRNGFEGLEGRRVGEAVFAGRRDELALGVCPGGCTDTEIQASRNAATEKARNSLPPLSIVFPAHDDVLDRREQVECADKRSGSDSWIR